MIHSYAQKIRRQLHQYPELGFDLERTLTLLKNELDSLGVPYTEKYGKSSLVATITPKNYNGVTIGIRADMDAIPVQELNDVPYKSKIEGQMHACGHDVHTAVVLTTLKELNERKNELHCQVKFIFQASEEKFPCGGFFMVQDGVMEDIDFIVSLHCSPSNPVGKVGINEGVNCANIHDFDLKFIGKSSHVAKQHKGIDAISMAVQAYQAIELMIAKRLPEKERVAFNVGKINGGTASNVIASDCAMRCTLRTLSNDVDAFLMKHIEEICRRIADEMGGQFEYVELENRPLFSGDDIVTNQMRQSAQKVVGVENVFDKEATLGGEDFAYYAKEKPACMFYLGVNNVEKGITSPVHSGTFDVDENALEIGVKVFTQFVFDAMNGLNFKKEGK